MKFDEFKTLKAGDPVKMNGYGYDRDIPCYVKKVSGTRASIVKQNGETFIIPKKPKCANFISDDGAIRNCSFRFLVRCEDINAAKVKPVKKKTATKTKKTTIEKTKSTTEKKTTMKKTKSTTEKKTPSKKSTKKVK